MRKMNVLTQGFPWAALLVAISVGVFVRASGADAIDAGLGASLLLAIITSIWLLIGVAINFTAGQGDTDRAHVMGQLGARFAIPFVGAFTILSGFLIMPAPHPRIHVEVPQVVTGGSGFIVFITVGVLFYLCGLFLMERLLPLTPPPKIIIKE